MLPDKTVVQTRAKLSLSVTEYTVCSKPIATSVTAREIVMTHLLKTFWSTRNRSVQLATSHFLVKSSIYSCPGLTKITKFGGGFVRDYGIMFAQL